MKGYFETHILIPGFIVTRSGLPAAVRFRKSWQLHNTEGTVSRSLVSDIHDWPRKLVSGD
ncbi:hypothetical protein E2C01_073163 [Portunus trituberculatus]|uniref:Uncharacterized protein n=1 Tax=Portunus trituberculatus TaxID=210409 RepID=A0A5B7I9U6_PORTR|nr:hypothetical protein [Portunus trituberculatus]